MNAPLHREMPATLLDSAAALQQVTRQWDGDIVRQLTDYIAIPAKSPGFDPQWAQHGHIETVLRNAAQWVEAQKVEGLKLEIVRLEGRTPVLRCWWWGFCWFWGGGTAPRRCCSSKSRPRRRTPRRPS
jgi:hypothetical protein